MAELTRSEIVCGGGGSPSLWLLEEFALFRVLPGLAPAEKGSASVWLLKGSLCPHADM